MGFYKDTQHQVAAVQPTTKHAPANKARTKKGDFSVFDEARQKASKNDVHATAKLGKK